ncbi:MAG: A/G-specific adenine glycosylase [Bacteroidaceae bacterium]|nr:A/G-specific adenine glycosylase [Bacteroidaceae bacterium]
MSTFSNFILIWYSIHKRDLPWRNTTDPYRIWISEIILQQTRVSQGYDYFLRFMERFPTVQALAEAPEDEVMRLWQGLGYYSRASNLHAAAKSICNKQSASDHHVTDDQSKREKGELVLQTLKEEDGSLFPKTFEEVRALKGVGDYTAAAICSFAYNMPYAVVDGNVYRVLARYFGIHEPINTTQGKKLFATLAQDQLDASCPADYNQAIMDFGALVCTPLSPSCTSCPLGESCEALRSGQVDVLPQKQKKLTLKIRYFHYLLVKAGDTTFIRKRTERDIWQNLYELPLVESNHQLSIPELLQAIKPMIAEGEEPQLTLIRRGVKHVLTHRIIMADFYELTLPASTCSFATCQQIKMEQLDDYAFPRLITLFLDKSS